MDRDELARSAFLRMLGSETTPLSPEEEREYRAWLRHYQPRDIDPATGEPHEDVKYDYRGYWKAHQGPGSRGMLPVQFEGAHGPDTFKQSEHPTFSQESQYSRGPHEGGMWLGETFLAQPKMSVSHKKGGSRGR